jgi:hypothetical protein
MFALKVNIKPEPNSKRALQLRRYLLCVLMLVFILAGCGQPGSSPWTQVTPAASSVRQSYLANWEELVASAHAEAARIDSEAVVQWVSTTFTYDQVVNNERVETRFVFVRPNGIRMLIVLEDSVPPRVVRIESEWDNMNSSYSEEQLQSYRSLLAEVKVGPRDIARIMPKDDVDPQGFINVGLFLDENYEKTLGVRSAWGIVYSNSTTQQASTLYASPQTGEILKRD